MRGEERSLVAAIISRSATIRAPLKWPPAASTPLQLWNSRRERAATELDSENVHSSMAWKRGRTNHSRRPTTPLSTDRARCIITMCLATARRVQLCTRIASSWTKGIWQSARNSGIKVATPNRARVSIFDPNNGHVKSSVANANLARRVNIVRGSGGINYPLAINTYALVEVAVPL